MRGRLNENPKRWSKPVVCGAAQRASPSFRNFFKKQLKFLLYSAWNVILPLVQNDADMAPSFRKHLRGALDNVPVGLLGFDNNKHHIHKPRQPWRDDDLADSGHVENNVI